MTMTQLTHRVPQPTTPTVPNVSTLIRGKAVPAIAYDYGRSALAVGHGDTEQFLRDATTVLDALGTLDSALEAQDVMRRHAIIRERSNGSLVLLWRETRTGDIVTEHTAGAVPVTIIEI